MGEFKFVKKVPQTDANCILKDFAEHYVDKEKLRKSSGDTSKKRSVCEQFASANWN